MYDADRTMIKIDNSSSQKKATWDEAFKGISWWDSKVIGSAKVLVVGAGALGNEVLKNLALLGVGSITIVDFDEIEHSNLCRSILYREEDCGRQKAEVATEKIRKINPNIEVNYIHGNVCFDVGLGIFRRVNVVIGCLDNRLARLYINRHCYKVNKPWIDGAILNLDGQLDVFLPQQKCYECTLTKQDIAIIDQYQSCSDMAQIQVEHGRIPTTPISASIIGAIQVQEAMKIIYGKNEQVLQKQQFLYYGMHNKTLYTISSPMKEDCNSHYIYNNIINTPLSADNTLDYVLSWISKELDIEKPEIQLDDSIVFELKGELSGKVTSVLSPKRFFTNEFILSCKGIAEENVIIPIGKQIECLDNDFEASHKTLKELGIPYLHIIEVHSTTKVYYLELSADQQYFDNL